VTQAFRFLVFPAAVACALLAGYLAFLGPGYFVLGLVAVALVSLFALNSRFALYALLVFTFFEDWLPSVPGLPSALKLMGVLVIGSWAVRRLTDRGATALTGPVEVAMMLFLGVTLGSLAVATDASVGLSFFLRYAMFFGLAIVVADHVHTVRDAYRIVVVLVLAGAAAAAGGLWMFFFGGENLAQGPLGDPNDLAFALCMAAALSFYIVVAKTGAARWLHLALLGVIVGGVAATLSRGAAVGATFGVVWGIMLGRVRPRYLVSALVVAVVTVAAIYSVDPQRVALAVEMKQAWGGVNVSDRFDRWRIALHMMTDNPVLGVGVGNYGVLYRAYGGAELLGNEGGEAHNVAHNMYLEVGAEMGVLGLLAFLALLGVALWMAIQLVASERAASARGPDRGSVVAASSDDVLARLLAAGVSTALVTLCVAGLFLTEQYFAPLWIVIGLISGLRRIRKSEGRGLAAHDVGTEADPHTVIPVSRPIQGYDVSLR